jgi:hypothetical protein
MVMNGVYIIASISMLRFINLLKLMVMQVKLVCLPILLTIILNRLPYVTL